MRVPSFELTRQNKELREELMGAIEEIVASGHFILGDTVSEFEKQIADYLGVKHAIGVGNGSDALYVALVACGVGPEDEVITTPFTFFATAGSIARAGATPVFADIDPITYNLNPGEIEKKITAKTKAILPVHLYGYPADMEPILSVAQEHGLKVVEDAAQAIGAVYKGKKACTIGDAACLSFFPTKNLGAFGDAGMVVTDEDGIAEKVRMLRVHGSKKKYYHEILGINSRLDALQAKILSVKMKYLDKWTEKRRSIAQRYSQGLAKISAVLEGKLKLPYEHSECKHVYHQYTIATEKRDELKSYLAEKGISSMVYYPLPLHLQKVFLHLGYKEGDFPFAEEASKRVLSLPMFPEMTSDEINYVIETVARFYEQ